MHRLFILFILLVVGCSHSSNAPIVTALPELAIKVPEMQILVIPPKEPSRTDLPINWTEVNGSNWSYGVPADFDKKTVTDTNILASNVSGLTKLTVDFSTYTTSIANFHQSVLADFILVKMTQGAEVLAQREKINGSTDTIAVLMLYPSKKTDMQVINPASLDFFRKYESTMYHLACSSELRTLNANSDVCFKIVDTLIIK